MCDWSFEDSTGAHARLLHGLKGEGKTTALRAFTAVCESRFPSSIPIYISYLNFRTSGKQLASKTIQDIVAEVLTARGVLTEDWASVKNQPVAIIRALGRSNKQLLVLVDEVDELYRIDSTKDADCGSLAGLA